MKRIIACFMTLILVISVISSDYMSIGVKAASIVVYDADDMSTFSSRTAQSVADKYSEYRYSTSTYNNGDRNTWFSTMSSTSNPYEAGVASDDTHKAMTDMTNFYRWLVGVDTFDGVSQHSDSLQAQALIRNFHFAHSVSDDYKPSDMSQELWDEGKILDHNILARGYTPQGAITGWLNEGYSTYNGTWDTLGHRYALIGVNVSNVQFGYSGSVAIGACNYEYNNAYKEAISAFPAPGYMPNNSIYPSECAWTVDFDTTKVKAVDVDLVEVKVTNLTTGASYTCSNGNDMAQVNNSGIAFVQPSDNTGSYYTDNYAVEVTGLTDTATGNPAIVKYTVKFFDVASLASAPVVSASAVKTNYVIYKTLGDTDSLKKIASIIPQEVVVTNDLGNTATIKTTGPWTLDEANMCFVNSASASDLPSTMIDKKNIVSEAVINYEISEDYYDSYNSLNINPSSVNEGDSVTFSVYRTNVSTDRSQIYQLKQDETGNYYGVIRFDSATSPEFDKESSENSNYGAYHYYVVDSAKVSDGGEYLSIYYSTSEYFDDVYVSTSFKTLKVSAASGDDGDSGDETGGESGGSTGGETGGESGGETGGESGGSTGGESGGSTGGETGAESSGTTSSGNWVSENGNWYYVDDSGNRATGWQQIDGEWYYMNSTGAMQTGWLNDNGTWYYLNSDGSMATSTWIGSEYVDASGVWVSGGNSGSSTYTEGWQLSGDLWWYQNADGSYPVNAWKAVGGAWYYFDASGWMKTGWVNDGLGWYYMNPSGTMATGWVNDGGLWYYLAGSGLMKTGWLYDAGAWYYLVGSGAMTTGWLNDNGTWYYFVGSGAMAVNTTIDGYTIDSNGAMVE